LPIKPVLCLTIEIENALTANKKIQAELEKYSLTDKIILLRLQGTITTGTNADINYSQITDYLKERGPYCFLKNTSKLNSKEETLEITLPTAEVTKVEETLVKEYEKNNPDKFNKFIVQLMHSLEIQKQEDEKSVIFETRLLEDLNKILSLNLKPG